MGWWIAGAIVAFLFLLLCIPIGVQTTLDERKRVWVRYGFLRFRLYDSEQPEEPKTKPDKKPKKKNKDKSDKKKRTWQETLRLVWDMLYSGGKAARVLSRHLHFSGVSIAYRVARGDASDTAIAFGKVNAIVYTTLGFLRTRSHLHLKSVHIFPDFMADEDAYTIQFSVRIAPLFIIKAGVVFLFQLFKRMFSRDADNNINTNKTTQKKGVLIHG